MRSRLAARLCGSILRQVVPLLGAKPDWDSAKKVLGDTQFMNRLINFDKDNIPEKIIQKLQPYIENEDFTPKKIESASKACSVVSLLYMWS